MLVGRVDRRSLVIVVFAVALVLRLAWMMRPGDALVGEASKVAIAFAERGEIADAYFSEQGPTAHLLPVSPAIAGLVFRALGTLTAPANAVLGAWALLQVFAGWIFLIFAFRKLGATDRELLLGLAAVTVSPFIGQETFDFRYWESGLAVCLGCGFLLALLHLEARAVSWLAMAGMSALAAVTFFVSPSMGLGVYSAAGLFLLKNFDWRRTFAAIVISAAILIGILAPWAARNMQAVGSPVLLRSNLGMELALANHSEAVRTTNPLRTYRERIKSIHPAQGEPGREKMRKAGGEVAYSQELKAEALTWMKANPGQTAALAAQHLRSYFFPSAWQFEYKGSGTASLVRAILVGLVSLFGLIGLVLRMRRPGYAYVALLVIVPALTYLPFQPMPRYIYLSYGLLAFLAGGALAEAWERRPRAADRQPATS